MAKKYEIMNSEQIMNYLELIGDMAQSRYSASLTINSINPTIYDQDNPVTCYVQYSNGETVSVSRESVEQALMDLFYLVVDKDTKNILED
jgi:hypothetical protein